MIYNKWVECPNCEGEGQVESGITDFELTPIFVECGICFGTGYVEEEEEMPKSLKDIR